MSRYLLLDVGAGTMDVLWWDERRRSHFKAVVKSPVRTLAEAVERTAGDLLVTGVEMGGGPVSEALRKRARTHRVVMSASAAATIHHSPERVESMGIRIADPSEVEALKADPDYAHVEIGDLEIDRIRDLVKLLGVPFDFDAVAVCAQDHGVPPPGVSHLDFRHSLLRKRLENDPRPQRAIFEGNEVPDAFNRLRSIAASARSLPAVRVYVMDSGMAAVLGASRDEEARTDKPIVVLDVATSHTVAAVMKEGELFGWLEYHTRDISCEMLDKLIPELADGALTHERILSEGGHGAAVFRACGFDNVSRIIATGPRRGLLEGSRLPIRFGAPMGDNMMTGACGLLEAVRAVRGSRR